MLEVRGVAKSYAGRAILAPTSLSEPPGRTVVLIGPSGCGKSTLLRIMMGLVPPDAGAVLLEGVAFTRSNGRELRRRMGYVIQDGGLFPHLSARDNAALPARFLGRGGGWAPDRIADRIAELAALVKLPPECLGRFPAQLSGGQRQRVGIMRALMLDPAVMLFDEPMGALDPLVRYELQQDLRAVFAALKKAVVLVTHDLGEAAFFGDDVALMNGGSVVQRGTVAEMLRAPADDFVRRFLTSQRPPEALTVGAGVGTATTPEGA
jgi:osmoprotectant transport system ATP-binding protein